MLQMTKRHMNFFIASFFVSIHNTFRGKNTTQTSHLFKIP